VWIPPSNPKAAINWSRWQRRHQQRAKDCHWQRRSKIHEARL
jgi:hypothetical protein